MSKKQFNYSKQFNKNEELPKPMQEAEVKAEVQPEIQQVDEIPQTPYRTGVVVGCDRLNVRKGPSKDTEAINVISKGTVVKIEEVSIEGWFKITTANDKINGYCMSEFIELR